LLIVTDLTPMRGFDYLALRTGLCLIVSRSFSSQREADQGLARIGRYHEKAERCLTHGVNLIDKTKELELTRKLIAFKCSKLIREAPV
jgi:hypothetical protein